MCVCRLLRYSLSLPDTLYRPSLLFVFCAVFNATRGQAGHSIPTPGFCRRLDLLIPFFYPRTHPDLPSSLVVPLLACPAPSDPGGGPDARLIAHPRPAAFRVSSSRRLSPNCLGYPLTTIEDFGAQSHSLPSCSARLRTPLTGFTRGRHYRPVGYTLTGWDLCSLSLTHWTTLSNFAT